MNVSEVQKSERMINFFFLFFCDEVVDPHENRQKASVTELTISRKSKD